MFRALYPNDFDRSRESQALELAAVLVQRLILLSGNQTGVKPADLPSTFEDLFAPTGMDEQSILDSIAEFEKQWG